MNILDDYTRLVLSTLLNQQVEFIIVGGYAVNHYGYTRTTGDIDIWIKPDNEITKPKLITAYKLLGISENALAQINSLDFEVSQVFKDGIPPFRIDFLTRISGVKFEEAWTQKIEVDIDNLKVPFIHYNHLIISKMSSSRLKDKLDIEELQKINKNNPM